MNKTIENFKNLNDEQVILHVRTTKKVKRYGIWNSDFITFTYLTKKELYRVIEKNNDKKFDIMVNEHVNGKVSFLVGLSYIKQ